MDAMQAVTDVLFQPGAEHWRAGGCKTGTIHQYLLWVRRFHKHFGAAGDCAMLTRSQVDAFAAEYVGPRGGAADTARPGARNALRAWSCALCCLGFAVPRWVEPAKPGRLA